MPKRKAQKKEESGENKYQNLLEAIEKMTLLELSEFTKLLEEKFGVSASYQPAGGAVPVAAAPAQGDGEVPSAPERSAFNVVLKDAGSTRIQVIKAVKEITAKGLTEVKEMVEKIPALIKEGIKKEEAEEIKKKLEAAGATVILE